MSERRPNGPIEDHDLPSTIEAKVITPGPNPRLHGFSVEADLALHYRYPELMLLALTGHPPDETCGRAYDIALQFLAPIAVGEAPTHAAVLARICGAPSSSILAVACIALAERARHVVSDHRPLFEWLDTAEGDLPAVYRATTEDDRACLARLRQALARAGVQVPSLAREPNRWAAILLTLHFAGLRRLDQWETTLVVASLSPVVAEAQANSPGGFAKYPMDVPAYVYQEEP
jgi:hypothetical protein